jgi:hypothetical protein
MRGCVFCKCMEERCDPRHADHKGSLL